jgi:hypothetical protein
VKSGGREAGGGTSSCIPVTVVKKFNLDEYRYSDFSYQFLGLDLDNYAENDVYFQLDKRSS